RRARACVAWHVVWRLSSEQGIVGELPVAGIAHVADEASALEPAQTCGGLARLHARAACEGFRSGTARPLLGEQVQQGGGACPQVRALLLHGQRSSRRMISSKRVSRYFRKP